VGDTATNKGIIETALDSPENFLFFNNGVSAVASQIEEDTKLGALRCKRFSIINGAQTVRSLRKAQVKDKQGVLKNVRVLLRIIEFSLSKEHDFLADVTRFNNTQNSVKISDFRSNDPVQKDLARKFEGVVRGGKTYWYKNKRSREARDRVITKYMFEVGPKGGYNKVFGEPISHLTDDEFKLLAGTYFLCEEVRESREVLKSQRLEQARQWLLFAGLDPPSQIDIANIGSLRETLRTWADTTATSSKTADVSDSKLKDDNSPYPKSVQAFYPTRTEQFLSLFQFKAEGQEQPQTVIVNNIPVQNPSHVLHKYSGTASLSQLVLSSSDLASVYSGFRDLSTQDPKKDPNKDLIDYGPCANQGKQLFQCLSRSRSPDMAARLVAATTLNLAYSENPQVVQGLIVPGTSPKWLVSGGVDFDPKSLFHNGTDWLNAAKALGVDKVSSPQATGKDDQIRVLRDAVYGTCLIIIGDKRSYRPHCLEQIAGIGSTGYKILSVLIPTITYKVQTQFDYYKATGGFFPNPFPTGHTYYFSFTTDLRKIIPAVTARSDAGSVLKVLKSADGEMPGGECIIPDLPPALVGVFYSYSLDDEGQSKRSWELSNCKKPEPDSRFFKKPVCSVNGIALSSSGVLSGNPSTIGTLDLQISVGGNNRSLKCRPKSSAATVQLKVSDPLAMQTRNQLVLDYLEMAISPDVVLDDRWFEAFKQLAVQTILVPRSTPPEQKVMAEKRKERLTYASPKRKRPHVFT
jgi:hypothetical protein